MPNYAKAGFFSIVSNLISSPQTGAVSLQNTQTMPLLRGDLNPNANAKGGGDITIVEGALASEVGPLGTLSDVEDEERSHQISTYTVREGDTLVQISRMFNVSPNTILWANDIPGGKLKQGQTLTILPVSGIEYKVKSGDTLVGVAKKYKADKDEILAYNDLKNGEPLQIGQIITIPDAEVTFAKAPSKSSNSSGGSSSGYFIRPTNGVKTQGLHGYNGIDLGSPVGAPIVAAASGVVIVSKNGGWNGGYGSYVVIKHNNGMQTLYAHMSSVLASYGETVSQGQKIGLVGSTGKSTGPHLHFEVRGGRNPF